MERSTHLAPTDLRAARTRAVSCMLAAASLLFFAVPALAQYTFVRIDAGNLTGVYPGTLNDQGVVAFTGFHAGNTAAVYKGTGGPLTTIAATGSQFTFFNAATINCAGDVGFRGIATTNGVYRGNGGPLTLIHGASNGVDGAHVDENGTMALLDNSIGILTGNGGPTTLIAAYGGTFNGFGSDPDVRNGAVAFQADLTAGGSAIYTSTSSVLTQVEASGGPVLDTQLPRIGCSGNLVWISNMLSGVQAIRTHINGVTSTFVDTSGPYFQFGFHFGTGINFYNQVAFSAVLDTNQPYVGIYTGPNPVTDKVIGPGDSLAGKIVRDAYLGGLNDIGQISFGVLFSDFTYGMFRADPVVPNQDPNCCPGPLDHFTCYKVKPTKGSVKFPGVPATPGLSLVDQFGTLTSGYGIGTKPTKHFCAPTNKLGEDPTAPFHAEHLTWYPLKHAYHSNVSSRDVQIFNQFNIVPNGSFFTATVKQASHILVPTAKDLHMPPPLPASFTTDHFVCYKIGLKKGTAKFKPRSVTLEDQFGPMTVEVRRPKYLCAPVNKNGEDPTAPSDAQHLVCYSVKNTGPKFSIVPAIHTNDQFAQETLDVRSPWELCVPSTKFLLP